MRYFLHLAYNGAPFHGWQRQPNAVSVQQTVEEALSTLMRRQVSLTGAGRTDTGVHARCMYAHFDTEDPVAIPASFLRSLNRMCGRDIALYDLLPVRDEAHARFDALSRTYRYYVDLRKSPFSRFQAWQATSPLDIDDMNRAAAMLTGKRDFTSFAKLHSDSKTNICTVAHARWDRPDPDRIVFTITADRFLRNMVRAVVGTLVDVGRGKLHPGDLVDILDSHDRCAAGSSMPAHALFLEEITYPSEIFLNQAVNG